MAHIIPSDITALEYTDSHQGELAALLVVEQKNGVLEETGQGLFKNYGRTSKNIGGQIHRNIDNIRNKFRKLHGGGYRLDIDYLI